MPAWKGRTFACAALLVAAGCDLTLPWQSGSEQAGGIPEAPSGFAAQPDPYDFDRLRLSWSAQRGIDGFELEGRVAGGPWEPLQRAIPVGVVGASVTLPSTMPELTPLAFRLRARAGSRASSWSEASCLRGVRAPESFSALRAADGAGMALAWTSGSAVATEAWLERAPLDGGPEVWTTVPGVALAAGAHVDRLVAEGVAYAYRLRIGTGAVWSVPLLATVGAIELVAPWGLTARKVDGGVELEWTNQSTTATTASVSSWVSDGSWGRRSFALEGVPSSAFDAGELFWPATKYRVHIARDQPQRAQAASNVATLAPFTLAGPPALSASVSALPYATSAARDAQGQFHLADWYPSPRVHRAVPGAAHETHVLEDAWHLVPPGVAVDGDGNPHSVFTRLAGSGMVDVIHEWWNGTTWDADVVLTGVSTSWHLPSFALASAGSLHVLYRRWEPPYPIVHVARVGGVTTEAEVTTPSAPEDFWSGLFAFAVRPDGSAFVAQIGYSSIAGGQVLVGSTRSPDGVWSDEAVPFSADSDLLSIVPGTGGDVALAYCAYDHSTGAHEVRVTLRRQGSWTAPETAATRESGGYLPSLAFAGAPDLSKLALSLPAYGVMTLSVRGASGWDTLGVGPMATADALPFVGVWASGAWALYGHGSLGFPSDVAPYSLFEEIP